MSEEDLSRRHSTKKTYSPDSNNDFDDRTCSMPIDDNNIIMKTPQSLDDLIDMDEHQLSSEEDQDENETMDDNNDHSKQKKSKKKHGKIE